MGVTVTFRGPMLLLSKEDSKQLNQVIIPESQKPGQLPDKTPKKPHFRGMLIVKGGTLDRIDLTNVKRMRFWVEGENGPPKTDPSYSQRLFLNDIANSSSDPADHLRRIPTPEGALEIELVGGEMSASGLTEVELEVPRHKKPDPLPARPHPMLTTWSSPKAGFYEIDGGGRKPIDPASKIYIYNWDVENPKDTDLELEITSDTVKGEFEDQDMKLVYTLFEPKTGTWEDWLRGSGGRLPVPRTTGFDAKQIAFDPPTSTCDHLAYVEK